MEKGNIVITKKNYSVSEQNSPSPIPTPKIIKKINITIKDNITNSNPIKGNPIKDNLTKGNLTKGNPIKDNLTKGNLTKGNLTKGNPIKSNLTKGNLTNNNLTNNNLTRGNPIKDIQTNTKPILDINKKNPINKLYFIKLLIFLIAIYLLFNIIKSYIKKQINKYNKKNDELPFRTPQNSPKPSEASYGFQTPSPGLYRRSVSYSSFNEQNI
jgi:hypothetical protein